MTSYSGLWDGVYNTPYSLQINRSPIVRRLSQALRRPSLRKLKEAIDVVADGASINGGVAVTHKRIANTVQPGDPVVNGGNRVIDVVTDIAGASVVGAAYGVSAASINAIVDYQSAPSTAAAGTTTQNYPVDKSGNGGGSKLTAAYAVHS